MDPAEKERIHRELEKASVKILVGEAFIGSGFFISNRGQVLTAYHCIGDFSSEIWVESPTFGMVKATLSQEDSLRHAKLDIAVLETHRPVPHYVPLGLITKDNKDDEIVAIGFPTGELIRLEGKILELTENGFRNNVTKDKGQSGGLIYHYKSNRVVGLTIQRKSTSPDVKGLASRFDTLFKYWQELKEVINQRTIRIWESRKDWERALPNYWHYLKENYSALKPLGKNKPIPLEDIFTDVYILNEPLAYNWYAIEEEQRRDWSELRAWEEARTQFERENGLTLVKRPESQRLFILGKPGAGKTTFLKYLTLQALAGKLGAKIPLFVPLKAWADSQKDLLAFLVQAFITSHFLNPNLYLEHLLETGNALVLFDGLDEVSKTDLEDQQLVQTLKTFVQDYARNQYLITCRVAANHYTQVFANFTYVEIADFTPEQMTTFVNHWFQGDTSRSDPLLQEFEQHAGLADMGRNPLLLSMLCLNFEYRGHLTQNRAEIYKEALDILLEQWDAERAIQRDGLQLDAQYQNLYSGNKKRLLAYIAHDAFQRGVYLIPERELQRQIEQFWQTLPQPTGYVDERLGEVILQAIEAQHGILVERTQGYYAFAHLSFQEYFMADYIVAKRELTELFNHVTDKRWREVFLLTASLLPAATGERFFGLFTEALGHLSADDEKLGQLLHWANHKAQAVKTPYRAAGVRSVYCFLALDLALALDFARTLTIARALARDLDRALAHIHALTLELTPDLALVRVLVLDLDRAINLDHARTLALVRTLALARDLDHVLSVDFKMDFLLTYGVFLAKIFAGSEGDEFLRQKTTFRDFYQAVLDTAVACPAFQQALQQLSIPESNRAATWRKFAEELRTVAQKHRDIGYEWSFTRAQEKLLETYFAGNLLLLESLKDAPLSDAEKQKIKDGLLLPM